mmetsp:Transcript_23179/g.38191  ORF Transcript_23179/g.38191 Transcript_23179/m.38191 type:complete len:312 (-) Transcript_23179:156-1091(-)
MKTSLASLAAILAIITSYTHHHAALAQSLFNFTEPMNLSSNMTIDWTIHNDAHTRYCGPKTVGGYDIAKKYCSPQTACGLSGPSQGTYGGDGNDCKPRNYIDLEGNYTAQWMCFTDIRCVAPSNEPSGMPSNVPSRSSVPSDSPTVVASESPSMSLVPSIDGKTKSPTLSPTISPTSASPTTPQTATPTGSPVEVSMIKIRGYFCGSTYDNAVEECDASKSCNSNADCDDGEECYPNVSCEFMASEANELGDHEDVVVVVVKGADNDAVPVFSNDGDGDGDSSFGFVCGVKGALVSLGISTSIMVLMCLLV